MLTFHSLRPLRSVALFPAFSCFYKNLKYRVFFSIFRHSLLRKSPKLQPSALFKPMVTPNRTPLMESDYNLHKSNSTYFTDLDVSRSHLVSYLCRPAMRELAHNRQTGLVLDPRTGRPAEGALVIALGSVECSFKREIPMYKGYETWSRILAWDRKWCYIVTHFLPRGAAKPTEWLDPGFGRVATRGPNDADGGWQRKMYASAVSKYVFKLGRLTVHPAVVLEASGLLPERPGGWTSGEEQLGDLQLDLSDVKLSTNGNWDWRRVEAQRRLGMEMAAHFDALDQLQDVFDGGSHGALACFGPG